MQPAFTLRYAIEAIVDGKEAANDEEVANGVEAAATDAGAGHGDVLHAGWRDSRACRPQPLAPPDRPASLQHEQLNTGSTTLKQMLAGCRVAGPLHWYIKLGDCDQVVV